MLVISRPGRLNMIREQFSRMITRLFNPSTAVITEINQLSPDFQSIRFQGERLKSAEWQPGDKIQVNIDLSRRTYTPIFWDKKLGESEIIAFQHANDTMASYWLQTLKKGDAFNFNGPRRSLNVAECQENLLFFGDETSFGAALTVKNKAANTQYYFEVSDAKEAEKILNYLGLTQYTLIEKQAAALNELAQQITKQLLNNTQIELILTGNAQSIQAIRRVLRAQDVSMRRLSVKPYWSVGKKGMD